MKNMKKLFFLLFSSTIFIANGDVSNSKHAISYDGGDRFGDRVLVYSQARYLSYATSIPLLYRPFYYSECLNIEYEAYSYDQYASRFQHILYIRSPQDLNEFFSRIINPNAP